jgi:hypothetical protein
MVGKSNKNIALLSLSSSAGIGIAMTDLFLSASAALIVALALSSNTPVMTIPIQADLLFLCPSIHQEEKRYVMFQGESLETGNEGGLTIGESDLGYFGTMHEFNQALSASHLVPRLFHVAALANSDSHPLTTTCVKAMTRMVRRNNKIGKDVSIDKGSSDPIFGGTIGLQIISEKIRVVNRGGE